ncbi:hypothetical protein P40081_15555 [Paenibacillus sp. FSL P4-0081]|uniref:LytTR family transcriptional regulator DNA-binding domain-containing protein n=1 Tax=Paenibacillus sp. FSL P4-0081 TaxID=1536769 RepID=UPI0004F63B37|nr:LytTR family transcriptional regulator DNA-binding domain-containing protein [Paenibacillus sp. FSL P4-0081]AIQ29404.1 hypothetical protein P40081_15555 [Paenibacillus sp. FSL P4-0081]
MTYFTVTKDPEGDTGLHTITVDDILMFEYSRRYNKILMTTAEGVFYTGGTLAYWTNAFINTGKNFIQSDRGTSINLDKVISVDTILRVVYFDYYHNGKQLRCTMSEKRSPSVIRELRLLEASVDFIKERL